MKNYIYLSIIKKDDIQISNINFPKNENTLSKRFFLGKKKNHIRNNKPINYSFIKNNIFNYKRKDS